MRAALLIAAKDLRQRLRDRSAVMIAVVVPLGLAFVFNLILSDVAGGSSAFRYAVVDEDGGAFADTFVGRMLAGAEKQGLIEVRTVDDPEAGRRLAAEGEVDATYVIPAGFTEAVGTGREATIRVIGNVDEPIATEVARSIADSYASDLGAVRVSVAAALHADGGNPDPEAAAGLAAAAAQVGSPIVLEDVSAATKELDPDTFYAAGMAVFFLFFTVQFGVTSLLEERNEGTLSRLLAAPITRASILGGKLLTSFLLGVVSMTVLVVASTLLLGADWGNPVGVGLLVLAGVAAAMGVMAVVATLAKNAEQAANWQAVIAFLLGLLGGAFFPISQAGGVIARLSLLTPHAWFLRGLGDLGGGGGPFAVLPAVGAILLFAGITGAIALLRLRRLAEP